MRIGKKNLLYTILVLATHIDTMVKEYDAKFKSLKKKINELEHNLASIMMINTVSNIMEEEKKEEEDKDAIC